MATNPNIRDQAYQFFQEEAPELLQTIEAGLLSLRQGRDTANIHQIMRAAHSIKGGAASVGLEPIKAIAHRLETLFKALYSDGLTITGELEDQLLKAYDCLRLPLTEQLTQGQFDGDSALTQAEPVLQSLENQLAEAIIATENFVPGSSDLGIDMAASIFEVDVQQGLDHLQTVLDHPQHYEVAGELRAQAEIFLGFAELLDLAGFAQIAETTLQALAANPDQVLDIARLAIKDFRQGQTAFLTQGSTTGGSPSAALSQLAQRGPVSPTVTELLAPAAFPAMATSPQPGVNAAQAIDAVFADLQGDAPDWMEDLPAVGAAELQRLAEETQPVSSLPPARLTSAPSAAQPIAMTLDTTGAPLSVGLTVRVDTQRLSRLENQLGELTINRNGLDLQNNQVRLGLKELTSRFERVRSTVEQLQAISDHILIAPERQRQPAAIGGFAPSLATAAERLQGFDSLEMDTYTALYSYTQSLLADMVQLEEAAADLALFNRQSEQLLGQHRKMLSQVQDDLMYARMVPLGQVLDRFPRVLRDLVNSYDKPAELALAGTDLLVDRAVVEKLYDPLLHLLRNGFDHGLETPQERLRQGKTATGQIAIRAFYRGRQVVIEIQDDGRGLNLERVRQRTVALGWLTQEEAAAASPDQISRYIFEPGFSTAEYVSDLSGRGIGLDVVREQLRLLRGTVSVQSVAGQGTKFTLALPMTLSIVNLLICFIGSTPIAFRSDSITEILVPQAHQLDQTRGQSYLHWQDQRIPLYRLSDLLPYQCVLPEMPLSRVLAAVPSPTDWEAPALILAQAGQAFGIQVDRLVTEQESVIKPFGAALTPPAYAYGCTVLGDGSLVPVIDGQAFLDDLLSHRLAGAAEADVTAVVAAVAQQTRQDGSPERATVPQTPTVMVVDDAVTSRRTLAISLERTGYRVLQARDGQEALEQLLQNPTVRLVVCDIEMPNMNGFEFLTQRRQNPDIAAIPTIMLTSRSNDKHRWLALQLGATDYFTKPYLEQEFLGAIAQHLQAVEPTGA